MFISPAYAQAAGAAAPNPLMQLAPFILIIVVMYFLLIRPQQQQRKKHMEMVSAVRRGDTVVTQGGLVGKVTKVIDEREVMVEIADGVTVRVLKHTLSDVQSKTQPVDKTATDKGADKGKDGGAEKASAKADQGRDKPANED